MFHCTCGEIYWDTAHLTLIISPFLSVSRQWPGSGPTSAASTTKLKSRRSSSPSSPTLSGASSSENWGWVNRMQTFHIHHMLTFRFDQLAVTSYWLGLYIFAAHLDIHPAGVPSAAWNEKEFDSSAAEEQEDHPWHHHPVLQVRATAFLQFFSPFFLTPALKFILYLHLAAALLVWTTAVSSTSTSPLCCCKKKARTWLAIWVQSRRRRSPWTTPTLWSECCSSSPRCTAAGSWRTVSVLPYRRSAHWSRTQIMHVKVQCVKCGDLRKKQRHQDF